MRPELAHHARSQAGLVTRRQAVAAGYTERELRTLTGHRGAWIVVRRGVYVEREDWDRASGAGRMALGDLAAHLMMSTAHVMSHDSAARALGVPLVGTRSALVHVTRPGTLGTRTEHGVKHHRNRAGAVDAGLVAHLPVTGVERTALDIGREHGFVPAVVACDWALHLGARPAVFKAELDRMTCWPCITQARSAYAFADPRAESPAESLARILVAELGWGAPEPQFPLLVEGRVFWCDLRLGCHVFEVDGRAKYVSTVDGGLASKRPSDVIWDEKKRERLIRAEGLGVSRIIWGDFWGASRGAALARLRAEVEVTRRRFGVRLPPHLEESARRLRGTRRTPSRFHVA